MDPQRSDTLFHLLWICLWSRTDVPTQWKSPVPLHHHFKKMHKKLPLSIKSYVEALYAAMDTSDKLQSYQIFGFPWCMIQSSASAQCFCRVRLFHLQGFSSRHSDRTHPHTQHNLLWNWAQSRGHRIQLAGGGCAPPNQLHFHQKYHGTNLPKSRMSALWICLFSTGNFVAIFYGNCRLAL